MRENEVHFSLVYNDLNFQLGTRNFCWSYAFQIFSLSLSLSFDFVFDIWKILISSIEFKMKNLGYVMW